MNTESTADRGGGPAVASTSSQLSTSNGVETAAESPRTAVVHKVAHFERQAMVRCAGHPLVHVALLALSVYATWTFPLRTTWSVVPLLGSLLGILLVSKCASVCDKDDSLWALACCYPGVLIPAIRGSRWLFVTLLFVLAPSVLGLLGVIPWYFGAYFSICAAIALLPQESNTTQECNPLVNDSARASGGSPRATAALFAAGTLAAYYATFTLWPYVDARGVSSPLLLNECVAWLERVSNSASALRIGALSSHDCGNTCAVLTRGGMTALVGNARTPVTLLTSTEQLHLLLFTLLFVGSVGRTWFLEHEHKLRSLTCDLIAVGFTLSLYVIATWWQVLSGHQSATLWSDRALGLVCATAFWSVQRWLLLQQLPRSGKQSFAPIHLQAPRLLSAPAGLCGLVLGAGIVSIWHDPGFLKPGRVMIDECHSDWEKSDLPMETEFYGTKTVYNYAYLKELLEKHYPSVTTNREPLTKGLLRTCDVLILKTPTKPYTPEEVAVVRDFVARGGGLWLIGDHTNIFGMNTYLNQIAETWGIHFNADAVCPLHDYYQQQVAVDNVKPYHECGQRKHETVYSRRYLNHPIIGHNIPYLAVLTSCSVSAPLNCEHITISKGTFTDHALFSSNTFFGNLTHDDDERYGSILQNVAVKYGAGRIAVWSDSTLFSNFSMCMSGVPQLALGYTNWLNRSNRLSATAYNGIRIALTAFIAVFVVISRKQFGTTLYGLIGGLLLLGCGVPIVDWLNTSAYSIGDYRKGFKTVGFEEQYSRLDLPNKDHIHQGNRDVKVYETFYVLMQRLHLMPMSADRLRDILSCDVVGIVNPVRDIDERDAEMVRDAVFAGRSLILMVGRQSAQSQQMEIVVGRMNRLLKQIGVRDRFVTHTGSVVTDIHGALIKPAIVMNVNVGAYISPADDAAEVLLRRGQGEPVASLCHFGRGKILLVSCGDLYNNANLGEPGSVPNGRQALLVQSCLRLVPELVECSTDQEILRGPWRTLTGLDQVDQLDND